MCFFLFFEFCLAENSNGHGSVHFSSAFNQKSFDVQHYIYTKPNQVTSCFYDQINGFHFKNENTIQT